MSAKGAVAVSTVRTELSGSVVNPVHPGRRVHAVLFDVDGTLYRQTPLRALMGAELAAFVMRHPVDGVRVCRVLSAYRAAQETLRQAASPPLGARQAEIAAERTDVAVSEVTATVDNWMLERPLKHLMRCRARGAGSLLEFLSSRRVAVGVLSDYPADGKLRALGLRPYFSVVLTAADRNIGVLKPNPHGFLAAASYWHLEPADILVVGDRVDADAAGAAAAGMACVIINGSAPPAGPSDGYIVLPSLERLRDVLDDDCGR